MEELDLEELESRLYSQVFHSSIINENDQNVSVGNNVPIEIFSNTPIQRKVTNYSVNNVSLPPQKPRYWVPNEPNQAQPQPNNQFPDQNKTFASMQNDFFKMQKIDQYISIENRKEQRKKKKQNKKNRAKLNQQERLEKKVTNSESTRCQCCKRFVCACNPLSFGNKILDIPPFSAVTKFQNNSSVMKETHFGETIVLSDSDDSVVYIEQPKKPIYVIESDTESESEIDNFNLTLNETTFEKISNLNLDCSNLNDTGSNQNTTENISNEADQSVCEANLNENFNFEILPENSNEDNEVSSTINIPEKLQENQENSKTVDKRTRSTHFNEISCTPDSTNDFIDDINLEKQSHFNFSLHDPDLDITLRDTILNSASKSDVFETESSCSDSVAVTPTKNIYNDEPQNQTNHLKNIFSDGDDLTNFSNFITPKRKDKSKNNKKRKSVDVNNEKVPTKASKVMECQNLESEKSETCSDVEKKEILLERQKSLRRNIKTYTEKIKENFSNAEITVEEKEKNHAFFKLKIKKIGYEITNIKKKIDKLANVANSNEDFENLLSKNQTANSENRFVSNKIISEQLIESQNQKIEHKQLQIDEPVFNSQAKIVILEDCEDANLNSPAGIQKTSENNLTLEKLTSGTDEKNLSVISNEDVPTDDEDIANDVSVSKQLSKTPKNSENSLLNRSNSEENAFENLTLNISQNNFSNIASTSQSFSVEDDRDLVRNPFSRKDNSSRNFSDFWTDDMEKFYDNSWGQECFNVDDIISKMPADPQKWKIIDEDKNTFKIPKRRKFCTFCRKSGHVSYDCPKLNNKEAIRCAICGDEGHTRARCPNLMCTTCGSHEGYLTTSCHRCKHFSCIRCNICNLIGHPDSICPDLWRRHHLSNDENAPLTRSEMKLKPGKDQWCSGCARRGHLYHDCRKTIRDHFQTVPYIVNYEPAYNRRLRFHQNYPKDLPSNAAVGSQEPQQPRRLIEPDLENYFIKIANQKKFGMLIKKLMNECVNEKEQYLEPLKKLQRDLNSNNDFSKKIGHLYKLRSLIRKNRR